MFAFDDKFDKILSAGNPTLEEPHDDHMVSQGHCVVVELEWVGEGECHGKHWHVLVVVKAWKDLGALHFRSKKTHYKFFLKLNLLFSTNQMQFYSFLDKRE